MPPDSPVADSAFAERMKTLPDDVIVESPLTINTLPPFDPAGLVVEPADSAKIPPTPLFVDPTASFTMPGGPALAFPTAKCTLPALPDAESPELSINEPELPAPPPTTHEQHA